MKPLSPQELAMIPHIIAGEINKVIAWKMGISESTQKVHMRNIMNKLNLRKRTEIATWALSHPPYLANWAIPHTLDTISNDPVQPPIPSYHY